ncbi:MAG: PDZ domain-containing protein [Cytophagaceae bacterium]|jgi:C-terminal processing protease CtpA/Prc|nr:PDZ domain-containing protein [Cytophagaceae bacterium]
MYCNQLFEKKKGIRAIRFVPILLFVSTFVISLSGCEKEKEPNITQKVNNFVHNYFYLAYLWNTALPDNVDPNSEPDPFNYIDKLIYKKYDKWSFLDDDAETLLKEYKGVSTTYGLKLGLSRFSNTETYFAVVQFVYANSPAEEAGLKRGDIIVKIDNGDITESNYMNLYNSTNITVQLGFYEAESIGLTDVLITMQSREMYLDPVLVHKIVEKGDRKIGYLCFTDFVEASHNKLVNVFTEFKTANVTDVVLDLRHNPGGFVTTANYLASILAPQSALNNKSVYLEEIWNKNYTEYNNSEGHAMTQYFNHEVGVNMDLSRLYILTSSGTASASEATIVSLKPYMEVIQIGETTHGKYCAAALIQPPLDDEGNLDPDIANWILSLVIYKYANSEGVTDFVNGIAPDYAVEDAWYDYKPLGDESDPLLAKAIELITGIPTAASMKNAAVAPNFSYQMIPDMDKRKGGMIQLRITN